MSYTYEERDGRKFAKFFLLNDDINLNQWVVTPDSIPKFIMTFIGKPFVEEPGEEHFGAENMETWEILKKQEDYRKGTIIDVEYNETKPEATVIVEIADDDLWRRIQNGTAIHVSPAIAGFADTYPDGTKAYTQWYGLHLARVKDPAYGVLHANIHKTCEGNELECINQLTATASRQNISFNPLGYTDCQLANMMKSPETQQQEKDQHNQEMGAKMASLESTVAAIQKSIAMMQDDHDKMKKDNEMAMSDGEHDGEEDNEMATSTAQYGNPKVGVPSQISGREKQKGTASIAGLQKQVANLTNQLAMQEEGEKSAIVDQIIGMLIEDEMAMDEDEPNLIKEMMMQTKPQLASQLKTAQAYHDKLSAAKAGSSGSSTTAKPGLASTPNRMVALASYGKNGSSITSTRPVTHEEIQGLLP